MNTPLDIADLPDSLAELVELLGEHAVLKLMDSWGGVRLYVPQKMTPDHVIARVIGFASARRLSARFPLEFLEVPRGADALRRARNRGIVRAHAEGLSASRLARKHRLTERQVWKILAASDSPDSPQQDLF